MSDFEGLKIGYAFCGSFCTFRKSIEELKKLAENGAKITPIMSFVAFDTNTRFGKAEDIRKEIEDICGNKIINSIEGAEPIGPKNMFDVLVVSPCTGNTIAKLAAGIIDTPVTMAVKSHIRNMKPVVLAIATNDALAGAAKNIGMLHNYRNFFFVPYGQDDYMGKPNSLVSDFTKIPETILRALGGKQIQPILL
ncbi:MAG: dipicolinate synthase subunit B [Oscillospiraceae bacterium]|nr:dipicolinate synthase subunit B [Oscillospiraceae bacterium]